jgi:hypothetical protein
MDTGGLLGPTYNYGDEQASPSNLGIRRGDSFASVERAVAGVNYYVDTIGFGNATGLARANGLRQRPLGIRYFMKTGQKCSNGADMYEFIDTIPKGLPGRVGDEIQRTLGVPFQGLAPGIMEDAVKALNPLPLFKSAMGTGYARCKKVSLPVGDSWGRTQSWYNPSNKYVDGAVEPGPLGPQQTRWVFDSYISQDDYDKEPKTEDADLAVAEAKKREEIAAAARAEQTATEGFTDGRSTVGAGVLFAVLALGLMSWKARN